MQSSPRNSLKERLKTASQSRRPSFAGLDGTVPVSGLVSAEVLVAEKRSVLA